jgi:hypothetical protein
MTENTNISHDLAAALKWVFTELSDEEYQLLIEAMAEELKKTL